PATLSGRVKENTEPLSGRRRALISPPMASTSLWQMFRPRPDPWCRLVKEVSSWKKGANSSWILSSGMPMPVSAMLKVKIGPDCPVEAVTEMSIEPDSVNRSEEHTSELQSRENLV